MQAFLLLPSSHPAFRNLVGKPTLPLPRKLAVITLPKRKSISGKTQLPAKPCASTAPLKPCHFLMTAAADALRQQKPHQKKASFRPMIAPLSRSKPRSAPWNISLCAAGSIPQKSSASSTLARKRLAIDARHAQPKTWFHGQQASARSDFSSRFFCFLIDPLIGSVILHTRQDK